MANGSSNNNWERIQLGIKSVQRLIGQKDYNSAMVKARQTLEFMVRMLAERSGSMSDSDLKEMIDTLYRSRRITKTSCDRYHKIRMIGNKAAHEGDSSPSNAALAYQLLLQEVQVFSNEYRTQKRAPRRSSSRTYSSTSPRNRRRSGRRRNVFTPYDLLKLLVPLLCILAIFCIVRLIKPKPEDIETTPETSPVETTLETVEPTRPLPTENSMAETPSAVYKTTDVLNVRAEPRTDSRKLGQLISGTTVEYVRAENEEWAVILYNGQEAYVASQYLTVQ